MEGGRGERWRGGGEGGGRTLETLFDDAPKALCCPSPANEERMLERGGADDFPWLRSGKGFLCTRGRARGGHFFPRPPHAPSFQRIFLSPPGLPLPFPSSPPPPPPPPPAHLCGGPHGARGPRSQRLTGRRRRRRRRRGGDAHPGGAPVRRLGRPPHGQEPRRHARRHPGGLSLGPRHW